MAQQYSPGACAAAIRALAKGKKMREPERALALEQAERGAAILQELGELSHAKYLRVVLGSMEHRPSWGERRA